MGLYQHNCCCLEEHRLSLWPKWPVQKFSSGKWCLHHSSVFLALDLSSFTSAVLFPGSEGHSTYTQPKRLITKALVSQILKTATKPPHHPAFLQMRTWIGSNLRVRRISSHLRRAQEAPAPHRAEPISLKYVMGVDCTERKHPTAPELQSRVHRLARLRLRASP